MSRNLISGQSTAVFFFRHFDELKHLPDLRMCAQIFPNLFLQISHGLSLQNRSLFKNSTAEISFSPYPRLQYQVILFRVKVKSGFCSGL